MTDQLTEAWLARTILKTEASALEDAGSGYSRTSLISIKRQQRRIAIERRTLERKRKRLDQLSNEREEEMESRFYAALGRDTSAEEGQAITNALRAQRDLIRAERDTVAALISHLQASSWRLDAERELMCAIGEVFSARALALSAAAEAFWADAVKRLHGNVTVDWPYGREGPCVVNGLHAFGVTRNE